MDPQKARRTAPTAAVAFLDPDRELVRVAPQTAFVGRRRELQRILRAFRTGGAEGWGVLLHGMGNLGKSSLAARVAARMTHLPRAVVVNHYDAGRIFEAIVAALPAALRNAAETTAQIEEQRGRIRAAPAALGAVLEEMLEPGGAAGGPSAADRDRRSGAGPRSGRRRGGKVAPKASLLPGLAAVLGAFAKTQPAATRLLLTSRYDIRVPGADGGDLAAALRRVPLVPMRAAEQAKQLRAQARVEAAAAPGGAAAAALSAAETAALIARALAAAAGNPGLQAALTRPVLAGDGAAEAALVRVERFRPPARPRPRAKMWAISSSAWRLQATSGAQLRPGGGAAGRAGLRRGCLARGHG